MILRSLVLTTYLYGGTRQEFCTGATTLPLAAPGTKRTPLRYPSMCRQYTQYWSLLCVSACGMECAVLTCTMVLRGHAASSTDVRYGGHAPSTDPHSTHHASSTGPCNPGHVSGTEQVAFLVLICIMQVTHPALVSSAQKPWAPMTGTRPLHPVCYAPTPSLRHVQYWAVRATCGTKLRYGPTHLVRDVQYQAAYGPTHLVHNVQY